MKSTSPLIVLLTKQPTILDKIRIDFLSNVPHGAIVRFDKAFYKKMEYCMLELGVPVGIAKMIWIHENLYKKVAIIKQANSKRQIINE